MSVGDEKPRAFPRYELQAFVDATGNEVLLHHRVQNISLGGICVESSVIEDLGTMVDVVIQFPELGATLAVKGEVVWSNHEPPMDMGIRYVDLDAEKKETLKKYLAQQKKTPAR